MASSPQWVLRALKGPLPVSDYEIVDALREVPLSRSNARSEALKYSPDESWHSWEQSPSEHPWLTYANLSSMMHFQQKFLEDMKTRVFEGAYKAKRYGFVGNMANNMMMRAAALRRSGYSIDVVLHPHDDFIMSQPGWEVFDGVVPAGVSKTSDLDLMGIKLPHVEGVVQYPETIDYQPTFHSAYQTDPSRWTLTEASRGYLRQLDVLAFPDFISHVNTLDALQGYDVLFSSQAPWLAYLSGKKYLAAQTGGDLLLEASRNDMFGLLQRRAYEKAETILATNPWAFSAARRFGFNHVLYAPLLLDTELYRPGRGAARAEWVKQVGEGFFVLATSRLDRRWKASDVGLEGFKRFASKHPEARLVVIGWGDDKEEILETIKKSGLEGRVVLLPLSGKKRLVDYLQSADCMIDQFQSGYYGATALEAMACGLPVIMRIHTHQYDALCKTGAPPVSNASDVAGVSDALESFFANPDLRAEKAVESSQWIAQNHTAEAWGDVYGLVLAAAAEGQAFDFSSSPLNSRLSHDERRHHSESLEAAPTFPNYN